MSTEANSPGPAPFSSATKSPEERHSHSLVIRMWPNIPILYPMAIAALICGIMSLFPSFSGDVRDAVGGAVSPTHGAQVVALGFLAAFTYTLVVVCTDIVLTWALLGIAVATIAGLVMFIVNLYHPFLPGLFSFLGKFTPMANAPFYFAVFTIWALLMVAGVIYSRFHYVKIESNEVVVVGGVLDKRKRYSSMRMQYTKEICDVFEYYLPFVRSGRLILRFPQEAEPIIIDHVLGVDKVIEKLDHVTATLQVVSEDQDSTPT
jgi:hypothetical protein